MRKNQLKCLRYIMRKEGMENLTFTRHTESKRNSGKQRLTYLKRLCKWIVEQGMGGIVKETKCYKGSEVMEIHDHPRPEIKWRIEKFGTYMTFIICIDIRAKE